jgi:hypothetical protein
MTDEAVLIMHDQVSYFVASIRRLATPKSQKTEPAPRLIDEEVHVIKLPPAFPNSEAVALHFESA